MVNDSDVKTTLQSLIILVKQRDDISDKIKALRKGLNYQQLLTAGLKFEAIMSYRKDNPKRTITEAREDIENHIAVNIIDYPLFKTKVVVYQ